MKHPTRNELIDALKFFAMGTVVLQHELNLTGEFRGMAPWLLRAMVAFSMPLFALLSGFVLWGREGTHPARFVWRKFLALIVPYVAWITVELPLRHNALPAWLPRLSRALVDISAGMQMWFLLVLFWMFVAFVAFRLVAKQVWWLAATAVVVGALPLFVDGLTVTQQKICWLYPFFIAGYALSAFAPKLARFKLPVAVASAVAFPVLMWAAPSGLGWRYAIGFAGIGAAWALYRSLPEAVVARQGSLGRLSLGIYGAQMVLLPFLIFGEGWAGLAISTTATLTASVLLAMLLERFTWTRAAFLGQWPRPKKPAPSVTTGAREAA